MGGIGNWLICGWEERERERGGGGRENSMLISGQGKKRDGEEMKGTNLFISDQGKRKWGWKQKESVQ